MKLLVVDDYTLIREPVRHVMQALAASVTVLTLEVLELIARGMPNKIICRELGLAERNVKAHVTEVLRALGVSSRTQAALAAARLGLGCAPLTPTR